MTRPILYFLISFTACIPKIPGKEMRAVHVKIQNDSLASFNKEYTVYYTKDSTVYELDYTYDSIVDGRSLLTESRKRFFVFHRDSLFGRLYYPNRKPDQQRYKVDSILAL